MSVTYVLTYHQNEIQPGQLQNEVAIQVGVPVDLKILDTDDGDSVLTIEVPDDVTQEQVENFIASHVPEADYGAPNEPKTDGELNAMDLAAFKAWVIAYTSPEREDIRAQRSAVLAKSAERGIT